jgi:hypothetical protein
MRGVRVVTKRWIGNAMDVDVSERLGATSDAFMDGEVVWSWRRDAGANLRRRSRVAQGRWQKSPFTGESTYNP